MSLTDIPAPDLRPVAPPAPQPTRPVSTNGMAIASLVLGILWIWGLGSILAIVFSCVSRSQMKASQGSEGGRGLAIAGLVLGIVGLSVIVLAVFLTAMMRAAMSSFLSS